LPSTKIYENKFVYVFAPLKETVIGKGHMIITTKKHYKDLYDIQKKDLAELFKAAQWIGKKIKEYLSYDGLNILHASGKSGQQSVLHFHIHLIPRSKIDGLDTWPKTAYQENNYNNNYKEIISVLS